MKKFWVALACLVVLVTTLCVRLWPLLYAGESIGEAAQRQFRNPFACEEGKVSCLINKKILDQKLKVGLAPWAVAQIEEDLRPFKPFTQSDIDRFHKKQDMLFRFQVQNGNLKISYKDNLNILPAYKVLTDLFHYLVKHGYVQNTDFLMGLSDYFIPAIAPTLPIFVFAKDQDKPYELTQVLVPDWMNMLKMPSLQVRIRKANQKFPWQDKEPLLFWRGGNVASTLFRKTLVELSDHYPDRIDAKFTDKVKVKFVKQEDHLKYKYLIAIDGARCTWTRMVWHLQSNSLTFKHTSPQAQWFYKGIEPYKHYIPVKDEQDLLEALYWAEEHPDLAQTIAQQSTAFVENGLTLEDMVHYYIALIKAYNKKLDLKT